jgi:hypothetical protein
MTLDSLHSDSRGVSEVIGSILVFGLVIALVSMLQVQAIPNANQEVEFEHSNQVSDDMADLQVAIAESVDTGRSKKANVKLGADYPPRMLFFNPPAANGRLRTTDRASIQIANADGEGNLGNYLATDPQLSTRSLRYSVRYNELDNAPERVREATVSYKMVEDDVFVKDATFIDGKEITLVAIGGEYADEGVESATVEAKPLSAPAKEYTLTDDGDAITFTIPTTLPKEKWDEILADEYVSTTSPMTGDTVPGGGHVDDASYATNPNGPNTLTVKLETGTEYTLRTGKVGFGTGGDPDPRYIVPVEDDDPNVATIEVRDGFNNPVSGVTVNIAGTSDTVTTGPDGTAAYRPSSGTLVTFQKDFDGSGTPTAPLEKVEVATTGPRDPTDPTVVSKSIDSDLTETCDGLGTITGGTVSGALVCTGSFRTMVQPYVTFSVSDDATPEESGIDYVEIRVLDPNGDLVTSKRIEADGEDTLSGRWVGPWLTDGGTGGRLDPETVEIVLVDRSGREVSTSGPL